MRGSTAILARNYTWALLFFFFLIIIFFCHSQPTLDELALSGSGAPTVFLGSWIFKRM